MRLANLLPLRFHRFLSGRPESGQTGKRSRPVRKAARLGFDELESRTLLTSNLLPIADFATPAGKTLLVPLTPSTPPAGPVTYTVQSSNTAVTTQLVTEQLSLRLNVSGVDDQGNPFTGDLTF